MFDFHEKRKIRSIIYSRPVIIFLVLITVALSFSVYNRYAVAKDMKMKLIERENILKDMKQRAEVLDAQVKYLQDDRGIEEELRNRFDVAREGEQVIILVDDPRGEKEGQVKPLEDTIPNESTASFFEKFKFW